MHRVILFHGYASNDPLFVALSQKVKSLFDPKTHRVNFFSIDHNDREVEKSCKSQSVSKPINILFDSSCDSNRIPKRQGQLRSTLSKFRFYFDRIGTNDKAYEDVKATIEQRCSKQKQVSEQFANKNKHVKQSTGRDYGSQKAA